MVTSVDASPHLLLTVGSRCCDREGAGRNAEHKAEAAAQVVGADIPTLVQLIPDNQPRTRRAADDSLVLSRDDIRVCYYRRPRTIRRSSDTVQPAGRPDGAVPSRMSASSPGSREPGDVQLP